MLEVNRWTADRAVTQPLADLLPDLQAAGFDALEIWQYHISRLDDDDGVRKGGLYAIPLHELMAPGPDAEFLLGQQEDFYYVK